jgi:hypothetical protein
MRSSRPSTASSCKPHNEAGCRAHSGSALRFSQPLSGFLANSSSTALFRAATVRDRNLQSIPLNNGRAPLPRPLASLLLSTGVQNTRRPRPYCLRFPRPPHPKVQKPGFPGDYRLPFHRRETCFPVTLGQNQRTRVRSASFTNCEAFIPLSSPFTTIRVAPNRRSLLSWRSAPLKFVPQTSEPRTLSNLKG